MTTRWLFGDQLGPHFTDDHRGSVLMIEAKGVFARRRFHRAKAHLVLSAMRHRAAELDDRLDYVRADHYGPTVRGVDGPVEVIHPTSYAALGLVERLAQSNDLTVQTTVIKGMQVYVYVWAMLVGAMILKGGCRGHEVIQDCCRRV